MLDFRSQEPARSAAQDLVYALAGGAQPRKWWGKSHERIIAAARALTWPSRTVDIETQACEVVGDEFYSRFKSQADGLHPAQWLRRLAEAAGAALRASVVDNASDWRPLWGLLRGLALIAPLGDDEQAKENRARFPDIKDPRETAVDEASSAAKLLANRGLAAELTDPADGCRTAGEPLIARDAYGSRFLLVAPFRYDADAPDHWYAWDIDLCWAHRVVAAGAFDSAASALAEWQEAVGPAAAAATLSPSEPETTALLLAQYGETSPLSDMLEGSEPQELIREHYRLQRRAGVLLGGTGPAPSRRDDDDDAPRDEFLAWYKKQHDDAPQNLADDADLLIAEWGPSDDAGSLCPHACSPHRIELTAELLRDGYFPDAANAGIVLLPDWTQWCIERSGLTGDFAARSRDAALAQATRLAVEQTGEPTAVSDKAPFRRQE